MVDTDATTIFDAAGRMVYATASLGRMLGYSLDELVGAAALGLVHPEDVATCKQATKEATAVDNGSVRIEWRALRSDGSVVWLETTLVNVLKNDEVRGVVVHLRDIFPSVVGWMPSCGGEPSRTR